MEENDISFTAINVVMSKAELAKSGVLLFQKTFYERRDSMQNYILSQPAKNMTSATSDLASLEKSCPSFKTGNAINKEWLTFNEKRDKASGKL